MRTPFLPTGGAGLADRRGLERQWDRLLRQEKRLLAPRLEDRLPTAEAVPAGVREPLERAFAAAFSFLFDRGMDVILRSCREQTAQEADALRASLLREWDDDVLRQLRRGANRTAWTAAAVSTTEGAALGLAGLGLPDLPVTLALLLRTVCSIAMAHGFSCDQEEEQCYLLAVLAAAASGAGLPGQEGPSPSRRRLDAFARCDRLARQCDRGLPLEASLPTLIPETAKALSDRLLLAKAVQGMMVVGVAGGVLGGAFTAHVGQVATLKYQKRVLLSYQDAKGVN